MDQPEEKKKKKRVNSKGKGNGFENVLAKKLSAALSPLKFVRTQGSGARVGGKNFETIGQMFGEDALKLFVGDVVPANEGSVGKSFLYSVECKFYKTPDGFTGLVSGTANVFKWMQEAITDAVKINRIPMLICKWNNTPIYVGCLTGQIDSKPNLTIIQDGVSIDIFYLDELLKFPHLWFTDKAV